MRTTASSSKSLIGIIVLVIVGALVYFFYIGNKAPDVDSLLDSQATPDATAASSRILALLNQISSLKIDTSLFNDPAYQSLVDYSVPIPEIPVGRNNPFAPISGVSQPLE